MAFHLYQSNKLKVLGYYFQHAVYNPQTATHPIGLFDSHIVIVQSGGMEAWLKQFLAEQSHIAANMEFPFMAKFVNEQLEHCPAPNNSRVLPEDEICHRIYRELFLNPQKYPELAPYLQGNRPDLKRWQLSQQLTDLFDQYQAYAQNTFAWMQQQADSSWQNKIYEAIFAPNKTRDQRVMEFEPNPNDKGKSINIFGVSSMPPIYMTFFQKLAKVWEVNFFYLNPGVEDWSDYIPIKGPLAIQQHRLKEMFGLTALQKSDINLNPILNNCGKLGRNFLNLLKERFPDLIDNHAFVEPQKDTLLAQLQSDISKNVFPQKNEDEFTLDDRTIRIHNCHDPLREVEILHDQLLQIMDETQGDVQPRNIIVMAPDITQYETAIRMVFGHPKSPFIHNYNIADRTLETGSKVCETLLKIFKLTRSRFTANDVFEILKRPEIFAHFSLSDEDLEKITGWIRETHIHWGIDEKMHESVTGIPFPEYTWKQGFEKLLLGMALYPNKENFDAFEVLPVDLVESGNGEILGQFILYVQKLFKYATDLKGERLLSQWIEITRHILEDFFEVTQETQNEIRLIQKSLSAFPVEEIDNIYPEDVFESMLKDTFSKQKESGKFLRGKVTFCSLMPMRSIPMKVVSILGLNDRAFPRRRTQLNFNLLRHDKHLMQHYKTSQVEDRFLFLEAILSAEAYLLLSYRGQSPKTGESYPPAVPLGELIDYLQIRFGIHVTQHKLQGFDPAYFLPSPEVPDFVSYQQEYYQIAQNRRYLSEETSSIYTGISSPASTEPLNELSLDTLIYALSNPIAYHLETVLSLSFIDSSDIDILNDDEPFNLDSLENYNLKQNLAKLCFEEKITSEDELISKTYKKVNLPIKPLGDEIIRKATTYLQQYPPQWIQHFLEQTPLKLCEKIENTLIEGVCNWDESTQCSYLTRYSKIKPKDCARAWCTHLLRSTKFPGSTTQILAEFNNKIVRFYYPALTRDEAILKLTDLLQLYQEILKRPIPVFGMNSLEILLGNELKYIDYDIAELMPKCFEYNDWKTFMTEHEETIRDYAQRIYGIFELRDPETLCNVGENHV